MNGAPAAQETAVPSTRNGKAAPRGKSVQISPSPGDESSGNGMESTEGRGASRLARIVVTTVFGGLCAVGLVNILEPGPGLGRTLLAVAVMAGLLSLQLSFLTERVRRLRTRARVALVVAQALLGFLPFLVFGQVWVGMPGFVGGSAALLLPAPYSAVGYLAAVIATGAIQAAIAPQFALVVYTTVSTVITGLVIYGLSRMSSLITELHETRAELARLAVFKERLRFARDLHDLLGYSLSAITLKSELTRRLVTRNPERALAELDEIRQISRQSLADVRQLASGYRDMSLADEARAARSVLMAADIEVTMEIDHEPLPTAVSTVLATVLREGITNLLQHSRAKHCEITLDETGGRVRMTVGNDGAADRSDDTSPHGGSGLRSLASRAAAIGGTLSSGRTGDGWFRLTADLPVAEPAGSGEVVPFRPSAKASRPHAQSG